MCFFKYVGGSDRLINCFFSLRKTRLHFLLLSVESIEGHLPIGRVFTFFLLLCKGKRLRKDFLNVR